MNMVEMSIYEAKNVFSHILGAKAYPLLSRNVQGKSENVRDKEGRRGRLREGPLR